MKAKELRIGNWVNNGEQLDYVIDTSSMMDLMNEAQVNEGLTGLKPIPLTEEWLLKFGFEAHEIFKAKMFILNNYFFVRIDNHGKANASLLNNSFSISINSVHQLQNLYFALTQEEIKCS